MMSQICMQNHNITYFKTLTLFESIPNSARSKGTYFWAGLSRVAQIVKIWRKRNVRSKFSNLATCTIANTSDSDALFSKNVHVALHESRVLTLCLDSEYGY